MTDMYQKRRVMEELQRELRQNFRGHHTITQIQQRWSDMKRRERSFVREVRREHVPDAQMPPRRHRGDAAHDDSDEAPDPPPQLDVGEEGGPSQDPPDVGPPALEAEPLGGPPDVVVAPEGPPALAAAPQHGRRRQRRSQLAAIARQLGQLAAAMQGALSDSSE
ncbi:protein FAM241B isoform X1 [Hyperolius riggenbachi]|uniref:protein FAM241B isoform X1 n=1 Tax=Hyperolius riggenbachi TaxID=752182 RepID=UPI0035A391CA